MNDLCWQITTCVYWLASAELNKDHSFDSLSPMQICCTIYLGIGKDKLCTEGIVFIHTCVYTD